MGAPVSDGPETVKIIDDHRGSGRRIAGTGQERRRVGLGAHCAAEPPNEHGNSKNATMTGREETVFEWLGSRPIAAWRYLC